MADTIKRSSVGTIILAWLMVGIPLGWGVYNTLLSSMKLFEATTATAK
jgi:hypothetical protein